MGFDEHASISLWRRRLYGGRGSFLSWCWGRLDLEFTEVIRRILNIHNQACHERPD